MSKSKNKNRSEVEFLKGKIRKLESQLKYFKKREHFFDAPVEDIVEEAEEIQAEKCPVCRQGIIIKTDFVFATLEKCLNCDYEKRQKK